jgi:putative methionine-R-sulfoxide reductase with GAF domain
MITFIYGIVGLGTGSVGRKYQALPVRISNVIAIIFFLAGIVYGSLSLYLAPQLTVICIALTIGSSLVLLLNYLQMVSLARFALNLLICVDVAICHGSIVQPSEPLLVSIYLSQFAFAFLPFIYVDLRERWLLLSTVVIALAIFVFQPYTNDLIKIQMDSSAYRELLFTTPTYVFSIGILLFCMLLLQTKNVSNEVRVQKLYDDIQGRNQEIEEKQKALLQTLKENKETAAKEERRNWVSKGLSQFSDLLRGEIDQRFYSNVATQLVNFMEINQVGIYVVEEEEDTPIIELKSCYAFDREKFLEKRIEIDQGLVGQCYLEQEEIFLKEVPESYIHIKSGLGDAPPRCVLIVPMVHEYKVEGIIELASFKVLEDHEIEFVKRLSTSMAAFVASNRINSKTKLLLQKFKQQSEELSAQEEEMRQNLEEMQATQEEIHRKEQEYINRIDALEQELKQTQNA